MVINPRYQLLLGLLFSVCIVSFRLHSGLDVPNYLWAEDGWVFFQQAHQSGFRSLYQAYAGYLHLYPRIWALIASSQPIAVVPYIYFAGWLFAFLVSIAWIVRLLQARGVDYHLILVFILLLLLQPNDGEIFFSLTNSQWFMGLALILTSIMVDKPVRWLWVIPLFLISLTGPFSVIALAILLGRAICFRMPVLKHPLFWVIFIGSLIQAYMVAHTPRPVLMSPNYSPIAWVKSYISVLLFGGSDRFHIIIAAFCWGLSFFIILKAFINKSLSKVKLTLLIIILAGLFLNITAVFFGLKDPYAMMGFARNGGGRYTFSPYALMIMFWILALESQRKCLFGMTLALIILFSSDFKQPMRQNMQFDAFVAVSRWRDIAIPINPASNNNIHSYLYADNKSSGESYLAYTALRADSDHGQVILKDLHCDLTVISLQMQIVRSHAGDVTIEWFLPQVPPVSQNKLSLHYPAGEIRTDFALPVLTETKDLRVRIGGVTDVSQIKEARYACLK